MRWNWLHTRKYIAESAFHTEVQVPLQPNPPFAPAFGHGHPNVTPSISSLPSDRRVRLAHMPIQRAARR